MLPFIILVALVPTAIMAQTRVNAYMGCSADAPGRGNIPGQSTAVVATSAGACTTGCRATNQYAYFRASDSACLCSDTSTPSYALVDAASGTAVCASTVFTAFRVATTFQFNNCGVVQSASPVGPAFTTSTSDECFDRCRFNFGVFISSTGTSTSEFECRCRLTGTGSFSQQICGPGAARFYYYAHPTAAATAGLTRRKRLRIREEDKYCPAGLTACRIQGSEDGYECIDTMSELESCGGCVFGRYGTRKRGVRGVNCAALDGHDLGSVTCKAGRCVDAF